MQDISAYLAQKHGLARTRQAETPYTSVPMYSSLAVDHMSTGGGLNWAAIVAGRSAHLSLLCHH